MFATLFTSEATGGFLQRKAFKEQLQQHVIDVSIQITNTVYLKYLEHMKFNMYQRKTLHKVLPRTSKLNNTTYAAHSKSSFAYSQLT